MNPQIFGALMDRLYAAGALEVFYAPVQMKKNRPGTLMTIVAAPEQRTALADLVFRETTTIGVRYQEMARECLDREMVTVDTPYGPVRFKVAARRRGVMNAQPEFDDLARLAARARRADQGGAGRVAHGVARPAQPTHSRLRQRSRTADTR